MKAVPLELRQANEFVDKYHRHHSSVHRDKFRIGCVDDDGNLIGVVQCSRPVSRILDDGKTIEVVRLCTDGSRNVCSFLYSRAARIAAEMGYLKIITYILEDENGGSLRSCGWYKECDIKGHDWNCPSRPRNTTAPTCDKQRWCRILNQK